MNPDLKRVIGRMKDMQSKLQSVLQNQDWVEEARRYAEKQGHEVKKLIANDMDKVRTFIERERKELAKFQKQLPGEVDKFKTLLKSQRKELEKLLKNVRKSEPLKAKTTKSKAKAKTKSSSAKKKASSSK